MGARPSSTHPSPQFERPAPRLLTSSAMKKRQPISLGRFPWIADTIYQLATNSNPAVTLQFRGQTLIAVHWYTETILPTTALGFINPEPEVPIVMPVTGATLQVFTVIKCVFVKAVMDMNHCTISKPIQMTME